MKCPNCGNVKSGVISTSKRVKSIERIRRCGSCLHPYHTAEIVRDDLYHAVKQLFKEGTPICIQGKEFCPYFKDSRCSVLKRNLDSMLCRAFRDIRDW